MGLLRYSRPAIRNLLGPQLVRLALRCLHRTVPDGDAFLEFFRQKHALKIGGPSAIFSDYGALPIYRILAGVDNCLFASETIWAGKVQAQGQYLYHARKPPGVQFMGEASNLQMFPDSSYDCVLASHSLEHMANPLRALAEWKRVLKSGGLLLLILPHKEGTFDWRRAITTLAHMVEDYENNVGEEDLTHLPEILSLHDLKKDKPAGTGEEFRERCLNNHSIRAMHHHVFDTRSAVALIDRAGFQLIRVDALKPFHIVIVAGRPMGEPDNIAFLGLTPRFCKSSPFPSDRIENCRSIPPEAATARFARGGHGTGG